MYSIRRIHYLHMCSHTLRLAIHVLTVIYAASCKLISYLDAFLLKFKLLYNEIIIQLYIYMIV